MALYKFCIIIIIIVNKVVTCDAQLADLQPLVMLHVMQWG